MLVRNRLRSLAAATVVGIGLLSAEALAAQQPDEAALLRRRVVLLEDRVAQLERELAELTQHLRERQARDPAPALDAGAYFPARGWRQPANWRQLRRGLADLEVRYLLGEPARIEAGPFFNVWYYPAPGGHLRFTRSGLLEAWSEPLAAPLRW